MLLIWENHCRVSTFFYPSGSAAPSAYDQLDSLTKACLRVLNAKLDDTSLSATLRFLTMLTRNDKIARNIQDEESLRTILSPLKSEPFAHPDYALLFGVYLNLTINFKSSDHLNGF